MQGILGEIIREILAHDPGMEIIDEVADLRELLRTDELPRSDVVIGCLAEGSDLPRHQSVETANERDILFAEHL